MMKTKVFCYLVIFSLFLLSGCEETTNISETPPVEQNDDVNTPSTAPTDAVENVPENPANELDQDSEQTRNFYMGFSSWPPGVDLGLIKQSHEFIRNHGDIFERHEDDGMPWSEALAKEQLPQAFLSNWQDHKNIVREGQKVFLMVSPLGTERDNLALYYGESDNMPLPSEWKGKFLGDEDVQKAYLHILKEGIAFWDPDYLSIGSEVNVMMHTDFSKWEQYKEFHQFIYTELKKDYPDLPIFATFTIQELRGDVEGANAQQERAEITSLLPYLDLIGVSAYSYGWNYYPTGKLDPIPSDFFEPVLGFGKPVAITESGAPSQDFYALGTNYKFDQDYQNEFITLLLETAQQHDFEFVINYASIDFDKLLEVIPPGQIREIATIWAYTGLQQSNGVQKKALKTWDDYYNRNVVE